MPIEIEGEGYIVETRLIGKEDMLLDSYGNGNEENYEDSNGIQHKLTPISSTVIPLSSDIRVSLPGATNVSHAFVKILEKINALSGVSTDQGMLKNDTIVSLAGTLSHAEKKTLIAQQFTNLGGKTLTFEFAEAYDIETADFFEFNGFYNGTLIIDLNAITISDSADIGQIFHIHDCSCKVEIKHGTIKHLLSLYGIKAENCPCFYLSGIAFFGPGGKSNYALRGLGINGVLSFCTYTDDNDYYISDIAGTSYNGYTDAKVLDGINGHNGSGTAHQDLFNAHANSINAHKSLFDEKALLVHAHTESEEAAAGAAVGEHEGDENAHASLFGELFTLVTEGNDAVKLSPGMIFPYGGSYAPAGYLVCDGSAISRTTYSALFTAIGVTFGIGNGIDTFNIPDLRGKFIRGYGGDSGSLGATQAEGLPNITGSFSPVIAVYGSASGAFSFGNTVPGLPGDPAVNDKVVTFSASRSSDIYGASSHVTPVNTAVNFIIRY